MSVIISEEILQSAQMTEEELRQEIALLLFERGRLSIGQAGKLAQMSRYQFQSFLSSRQIPVHYDVAEFEADLHTLRELGRL